MEQKKSRAENYFDRIKKLLSSGIIETPPNLDKRFFRVRINQNREILGWDLIQTDFQFSTLSDQSGAKLKATENVGCHQSGDNLTWQSFSFHFQPAPDSHLRPYRFDKEINQEPHANADFSDQSRNHFSQSDLQIRFDDMNLYLALRLGQYYQKFGLYPLENHSAKDYNQLLNKNRQEIFGN